MYVRIVLGQLSGPARHNADTMTNPENDAAYDSCVHAEVFSSRAWRRFDHITCCKCGKVMTEAEYNADRQTYWMVEAICAQLEGTPRIEIVWEGRPLKRFE